MVHFSHAHMKRLILGYFLHVKSASANGHSTVLVRSGCDYHSTLPKDRDPL